MANNKNKKTIHGADSKSLYDQFVPAEEVLIKTENTGGGEVIPEGSKWTDEKRDLQQPRNPKNGQFGDKFSVHLKDSLDKRAKNRVPLIFREFFRSYFDLDENTNITGADLMRMIDEGSVFQLPDYQVVMKKSAQAYELLYEMMQMWKGESSKIDDYLGKRRMGRAKQDPSAHEIVIDEKKPYGWGFNQNQEYTGKGGRRIGGPFDHEDKVSWFFKALENDDNDNLLISDEVNQMTGEHVKIEDSKAFGSLIDEIYDFAGGACDKGDIKKIVKDCYKKEYIKAVKSIGIGERELALKEQLFKGIMRSFAKAIGEDLPEDDLKDEAKEITKHTFDVPLIDYSYVQKLSSENNRHHYDIAYAVKDKNGKQVKGKAYNNNIDYRSVNGNPKISSSRKGTLQGNAENNPILKLKGTKNDRDGIRLTSVEKDALEDYSKEKGKAFGSDRAIANKNSYLYGSKGSHSIVENFLKNKAASFNGMKVEELENSKDPYAKRYLAKLRRYNGDRQKANKEFVRTINNNSYRQRRKNHNKGRKNK